MTKKIGCSEDEGVNKGTGIVFVDYKNESRLEDVDRLVACDLSEPYSIFTYRYFLNRFPDLCILASDPASGEICGCVVGKIDTEEAPESMAAAATPEAGNPTAMPQSTKESIRVVQTGYIGMLAVSKSQRRKGIGKDLVRRVLQRMKDRGCESVTLETVSLFSIVFWEKYKGDMICCPKCLD